MASKRKKTAALTGRRVRLFKNGRSQAVRIPREWELPGSEAMIRKDGDRLIVSPAPKKSLLAALRRLGPLPEKDRMPPSEDFPLDGSSRSTLDPNLSPRNRKRYTPARVNGRR